jgi:hypothetical protein
LSRLPPLPRVSFQVTGGKDPGLLAREKFGKLGKFERSANCALEFDFV